DWAYEEEFGARDGFRWSPDGKYIAYWQVDASDIRVFNMINNTDSIYSYNVPVQYPKVGEDPSNCKIGYISAEGGETTWLNIPGDQKQNYLPRMMWSQDSKKIFAQQIPRKQNTNRIWSYDLAAHEAKNIFTDKDDAWVDVVNDWIWLNKGKEFTWLSDKDGWRHFYRVSADGSGEKLVTIGDYDVVSIEEIDVDGGYVYFIASPENPTQRYLYRVPIKGSAKPERLSPADQPGSHSYQIAAGGKYAFHTYSTANTPPTIDVVSLPKHKSLRILAANQKLKDSFAATAKLPVEFFSVTTEDDVEMQGYIMRPPDFDESKRYPVLFFVYSEPAGQTARDTWGGSRGMWSRMLTQQGY
ncbi:MAG: DPP IV N-terminal domain-containing protein, partial [Desulfobulbia bacterium]